MVRGHPHRRRHCHRRLWLAVLFRRRPRGSRFSFFKFCSVIDIQDYADKGTQVCAHLRMD
jgi:hypothetical protein